MEHCVCIAISDNEQKGRAKDPRRRHGERVTTRKKERGDSLLLLKGDKGKKKGWRKRKRKKSDGEMWSVDDA